VAVDPWYDFYYGDPCWDYAYYEWNWHACPHAFNRIQIRQSYSVVSLSLYPRLYWLSYYWPYGYYGYPSYSRFSFDFGLHFGYGYQPAYYRSHHHRLLYPTYGYPYGGYYPTYGYARHRYVGYGVVRYGRARTVSTAIRPSPVYRGRLLMSSSSLYKESPQRGGRLVATTRPSTSGTTAATRAVTDGMARMSSPQDRARPQKDKRRKGH